MGGRASAKEQGCCVGGVLLFVDWPTLLATGGPFQSLSLPPSRLPINRTCSRRYPIWRGQLPSWPGDPLLAAASTPSEGTLPSHLSLSLSCICLQVTFPGHANLDSEPFPLAATLARSFSLYFSLSGRALTGSLSGGLPAWLGLSRIFAASPFRLFTSSSAAASHL